MRPILLLALLITQSSVATECLPAHSHQSAVLDSHESVVLRGEIESVPNPNPYAPSFSKWLKLASPICVEGTACDGFHFKKEVVRSLRLLTPAKLLEEFRPGRRLGSGQRVTLRGELLGPAVNDEGVENVYFAITEVL